MRTFIVTIDHEVELTEEQIEQGVKELVSSAPDYWGTYTRAELELEAAVSYVLDNPNETDMTRTEAEEVTE